MASENPNRIRCTQEREVFRNKYATVYDDLVEFPSGESGAYLRFKWAFPFGVGIIPVIRKSTVILIQQYSYSLSRWILQIPKGMGSEILTPKKVAENELREEIGGTAKLRPLKTIYANPGIISNPIHLFVADDVILDRSTSREHSELIGELVEVDLLANDLPWLGDVEDSVTLAALLLLKSQLCE